MRQGNRQRGIDVIMILSGSVAVMGTLPLTPKVMNATADMTYRALISNYGAELASWGMLVHAFASFVFTFFALLLVIDIALRLLIQKIGRLFNRTRPPGWH